MSVTSPSRTPDMVTGDPTLRSPMLSNSAFTRNPALALPSFRPLAGSCVVRNSSAAKPSNTNNPVPISSVRLARMVRSSSLQECRGQHVIEQQSYHRGGDHGARGGEAYAFRGGLGVIALVHRDQTAGNTEHQALGEP